MIEPAGGDGQPFDATLPQRVHVVGIGGTGMSAIAEVLLAMGHDVTGTDERDSPTLARLRSLGIDARVGHHRGLAASADVVTASTAIPASDADLVEAHREGRATLSRADALVAICACRRTIAVAGTHGKTTTAALVATALTGVGADPSYVIGAPLAATGSGARWGSGEWLVVEADESDGTFLRLPAEVAVVTSVEADHLNYWGDLESLQGGFRRFVAGSSGWSLVCADDPGAAAAGAGRVSGSRTYGRAAGADVRIVSEEAGRLGTRVTLAAPDDGRVEMEVPLPGHHNVLNATAALAVAGGIGLPVAVAAGAIGRFAGIARRFQIRGEVGGVTFVEDFAHLPTEVAAALAAARDGRWDRVVCVFQPHRFTRTRDLAAGFGPAFSGADLLAVTSIYGSGEAAIAGVTGRLVADAVAADPGRPEHVEWLPDRADVVAWLRATLRSGDLCLILGAGDVNTLVVDMGVPS